MLLKFGEIWVNNKKGLIKKSLKSPEINIIKLWINIKKSILKRSNKEKYNLKNWNLKRQKNQLQKQDRNS